MACVLRGGCRSGTQEKVVACVLHDVRGSRTVGQWYTALNCIITYFSPNPSLLWWERDTGQGSGMCVT
jgi:hypothetical protein